MSFTFGQPTTNAGSTFGAAQGSLFGGGDANKAFQGTPAGTDNKPSVFSSPTTSTPAFGGFAFGAKTTASTSLFSTPSTTTSAFGAAKPLSFGFSSPPNQTVGPAFGQTTQNQNAPQSQPFGMMNQPKQEPAFGTQTTQASTFGTPAASGFTFNKPAASGFNFATPTSGFSAPMQPATSTTSTAPQTSQSSFNLGTSTTATNAGPASSFGQFGAKQFSFGGTPASTSSTAPSFGGGTTQAIGFGQQMTMAGQSTQPTSSFGTPTVTQTQPGLNLAPTTQASTFGANTSQPTTQTTNFTTNLSFGSNQSQMLQFGQKTTQASLSFGTTPTQQSFGQAQAKPSLGTTQSQPISFGTTQPSVSFSAVPSQTQSFGTTSQTTQPSISFGATTQATSLSFGTTPQTTPALNFGTTTTQATSLSLSTAQSSQPTSLSFGTTAQSSQPTSLSFGTTVQSSQPASFGTTQTTQALSFGAKPATSQPTTVAPSTSGLNFGATTSAGLSFGTSTGLSFGKTTTTTTTSGTSLTSAPSGITALGKATTTSAMPALTTVTTSAPSGPPAAISSITFAQLEENINKWTLELEEQERVFINQATQINAWDRLLIANGEKIIELNDAVETVKNEQQGLEHELDFVLAQQKELEELLAPLEKQLLEDTTDRVRDPEREHMYSLAESLDTQLRQMSEDLKEVIEHLNETNRSQDSNDPIVQIGRILNAHMSSMQWIDNSIAQISTKLDHLKATHDTLRRDNERSFQLTYN